MKVCLIKIGPEVQEKDRKEIVDIAVRNNEKNEK